MSTADRFWARRLRWRLIGAWRWPLFLLLTIADAFVVHWLPPNGTSAKFFPWLFISAFANLFLIGAIAPWLARRIVAREGDQPPTSTFPPANHLELLTDRIASIVLVISTVGLLVAGAGNHKVVVAATDRLANGAEAAKAFVDVHAPPEIRRNIDALNSHELQQDGLFRMCVPYNDRLKAYCMYVNVTRKPPTVKPDPDSQPNGKIFGLNGQ